MEKLVVYLAVISNLLLSAAAVFLSIKYRKSKRRIEVEFEEERKLNDALLASKNRLIELQEKKLYDT